MAKLIKLYRRFEIKWDKDRRYVVISPGGKLVQGYHDDPSENIR